MKEINITQIKICPRCGQVYHEPPALSRIDDQTLICPDCGKKIDIFGHSKLEEVAKETGLDILGRMPIDPKLAELCDEGRIEEMPVEYLESAVDKLIALPNRKFED